MRELKYQIEEEFFHDTFFTYSTLVTDIMDGKVKNIGPYKDLPYWEAQKKYDAKKIFDETPPLKLYSNGMKWINVGKRCHLVGDLMRNCGSAGLMSNDPDRTLLVLFDGENKPHVIVTYSPNEKKLSSEQGGASTAVKNIYHKYVLDLAKKLDAELDTYNSKSKLLSLKFTLRNKAKNIRQINNDVYNELFRFTIDNRAYYTNGYVALSDLDLEQIKQNITNGNLKFKNAGKNLVSNVFNYLNQPLIANLGIKYIPINNI